MLDAPHARDGCRDGRVLEDEAEREFRQVHTFRNEHIQAFDPLQRLVQPFRG